MRRALRGASRCRNGANGSVDVGRGFTGAWSVLQRRTASQKHELWRERDDSPSCEQFVPVHPNEEGRSPDQAQAHPVYHSTSHSDSAGCAHPHRLCANPPHRNVRRFAFTVVYCGPGWCSRSRHTLTYAAFRDGTGRVGQRKGSTE